MRLLLGVVAALVCFGLLAAPADGARAPTCQAKGSRTVVQNAAFRVYAVTRGETTTLTGCRRADGRRRALDTAFDDGYVASRTYRAVRLNGASAAWITTATDVSCKAACPPGYEPTRESIAVADLRARRSPRRFEAAPVGDALVVSAHGAVAWAAQGAAGAVELRTSARGGEDRLLDSGAIDPRSLAVERTIASWRRDGVERFARLG